ncbi:Gfo/Idh/MocA family oxidoreductase [Rubellicoccus peritrichatus]|uniref:Gfo/Idh/MocA family oxidoreductase n=1 Tax=Rubellicoccus peritrichatus TaxID=3080537 RepID=A0AAQ3QWL2_9BACT|nr:Gfo/Idh/MocA family oxidoreductase [Puniceicoccus sp. CR14]WOO42002.1 Gfo/Idh/MocA family oxidoreductase [Puniceicoccus sp. CR14]
MNRRKFIIGTAALGASTLPLFSIGKPTKGQFDDLRVGCIGMGRITIGLLNSFMTRTTVVAVCDVDTTRREHALNRVHEYYGNQDCKAYIDYRDLLARDDIDIVVIATPDHWHASMVIDAARAGKDIYCEKPLTHDLDESIQVMREVEDAGVVLQTGSQQRSNKEFRLAAELARNEVAGKIIRISSNFWGPGRPCDLGEESLEPGLDWNRWLGLSPMRPYHSVLSPRGFPDRFPMWRAFQEFGGGGVCDMGAHHLDIIQWALDMDTSGPVKALPPPELGNGPGARLVYDNGIEVTRQDGFHVDIECENGRIQASRGQFQFQLEGETIQKFLTREDGGSLNSAVVLTEREFLKDAKVRLPRSKNGHVANFLDCVISRDKPIANAEVGSRSAMCCHLMNLSYYHQQPIYWDPQGLRFTDESCDPAWLKGSRRQYSS